MGIRGMGMRRPMDERGRMGNNIFLRIREDMGRDMESRNPCSKSNRVVRFNEVYEV